MQFALIVKGLKINSGWGARHSELPFSITPMGTMGSEVRGEKFEGKVAYDLVLICKLV